MGEEIGRHRGNLGGVGRTLGAWTDLGSGMGERVLSLDQGTREPGEGEGECKVEAIVPEVPHLGEHSKMTRNSIYAKTEQTRICFLLKNIFS